MRSGRAATRRRSRRQQPNNQRHQNRRRQRVEAERQARERARQFVHLKRACRADPVRGRAHAQAPRAPIFEGLSLWDAACTGVLIHALAGDQAAQQGERGMLAGDLLSHLRQWVNP